MRIARATSKNIGHRKSARTQTFQPRNTMGQALPWPICLPFRASGGPWLRHEGPASAFSPAACGTLIPRRSKGECSPLRSRPHIPVPADAIATRSHLPLLTVLAGMPFVVFPPPSHKLHLGSPRGGDGTRSLRERADRRTGTSLPSSARVRQATCPSNVLPYLVTRIGPGLPASLSSQPKQSLLTGREVRAAKRRRPLHLEGGQHAPHVGGPISSKSRYAPAD